VIPGEEMKNGKPQTYPVMKCSCPRIRTYLDRFRPRLQGADKTWLFPRRNGHHKHVVVLGGQISKLIKDELRLDFYPHLFRHLAGELYLTAYAGDYGSVADLLGHEGTATARLYYTTPRVRAAVERLDKVVLGLGARLPAPAKGRQRR
jgi:integrase